MKLNLALVCLTSLTFVACGGSGDGDSGSNPDDGAEVGDGDGDGDGDDEPGPTGDGDGDGDGDGPGFDPEITPTLLAPGLTSSLSIELPEEATVVWGLVSQPEESNLSAVSLKNSSTAEVSFVPQRAGTYVFSAKVTLDGKQTEHSVEVQIKGYPVPFSYMTVKEGKAGIVTGHQAMVVSSGGGEATPVGCLYSATDDVSVATDTDYRSANTAVFFPRDLEDEALIYSRIVSEDENDGLLEIASSASDCETAPPTLKNVAAKATVGEFPFIISPNGERFMGIANYGDTYAFYTWSEADPVEEVHFLASAAPALGEPVHQAWIDDDTVAGITLEGEDEAARWVMKSADDVNAGGESATTIMDCDAVPEVDQLLPSVQFEFRGETLFLLGNDGSLYAMSASEGQYNCDATSDQNLLVSGMHEPVSFDVDRTGTRVAFESGSPASVYVGPADGSSTPTRLSPEDETEHREPHFALQGEQIVWTSQYLYEEPGEGETAFAEGNLTRIFRVNADGGSLYLLWQSEVAADETGHSTIGKRSGTSCTFGIPLGGGPGGLAVLFLGMGLLAYRRRRSVG